MATSNEKGYCTAKICQTILFILSLIFLYLTISCYHYYITELPRTNARTESPIYKSAIVGYEERTGRGSLPNMPAGFAIASAICMLGVGIIEAAKVATSTNYI